MFFSDREKQIYTSPLGQKYDPVDLYNRLSASCPNLCDTLGRWWGDDESGRAAAALVLAKASRAAFNLKPFDQPDGVMDAQALEALYHFLEWREGKG